MAPPIKRGQNPPLGEMVNRAGWGDPNWIGGNPNNLPARPQRPILQSRNLVRDIEEQRQVRRGAPVRVDFPETQGVRDLHRYAFMTEINFALTTASQLLLQQPNGFRNLLAIRNTSPGTEIVYIGFDTQATTNSFLAIEAGQIILFDSVVPQDDIYALGSAATATVTIGFSAIPNS